VKRSHTGHHLAPLLRAKAAPRKKSPTRKTGKRTR
jgi:hypothetical protein